VKCYKSRTKCYTMCRCMSTSRYNNINT